ncbi:MAG: hypothetical protein HWQ41_21970 [Nostoc sp. NOS(2021)]|uniref:hypothetical protein n=1 Tax=Nostoc sp. NOS(2021) TaxID=2815407 RepID=UPI0025D24F0B|nr:hypothetical protein [Nostoc sp. NOS(2021)]MBN3897835.1 hypothetical protein [Nostoc sp. NOS(2021)]
MAIFHQPTHKVFEINLILGDRICDFGDRVCYAPSGRQKEGTEINSFCPLPFLIK